MEERSDCFRKVVGSTPSSSIIDYKIRIYKAKIRYNKYHEYIKNY